MHGETRGRGQRAQTGFFDTGAALERGRALLSLYKVRLQTAPRRARRRRPRARERGCSQCTRRPRRRAGGAGAARQVPAATSAMHVVSQSERAGKEERGAHAGAVQVFVRQEDVPEVLDKGARGQPAVSCEAGPRRRRGRGRRPAAASPRGRCGRWRGRRWSRARSRRGCRGRTCPRRWPRRAGRRRAPRPRRLPGLASGPAAR